MQKVYKGEEENRIREELAKRNHLRHMSDIKKVVDMPEGRRYIWSVLSRCGVMQASMRASPYDTAFMEGRRDIGLQLMNDLMEAVPEAYDKMRREDTSNAKVDEQLVRQRLSEYEFE